MHSHQLCILEARTKHDILKFDCRHCVDVNALHKMFQTASRHLKCPCRNRERCFAVGLTHVWDVIHGLCIATDMTWNESCWSIEIVWLKSYNVKPCWCVTSSVHAEFAIHRKWCEWQWDKVRALLKGDARSVSFGTELIVVLPAGLKKHRSTKAPGFSVK